jgi:hypothetical protein
MLAARSMWKLWRIGGMNPTVDTENSEREKCPVPLCHPKIPILCGEVLLRRGFFEQPMRICVDNRKRF